MGRNIVHRSVPSVASGTGVGGESQNISPVDREGLLFMHQSSGLSRTGIRMVFLDFAIVTEFFSKREG